MKLAHWELIAGHTFRRCSILSEVKFIFADEQYWWNNEQNVKIPRELGPLPSGNVSRRVVSTRLVCQRKLLTIWSFVCMYTIGIYPRQKVKNREEKWKQTRVKKKKNWPQWTKILIERNEKKQERNDEPSQHSWSHGQWYGKFAALTDLQKCTANRHDKWKMLISVSLIVNWYLWSNRSNFVSN